MTRIRVRSLSVATAMGLVVGLAVPMQALAGVGEVVDPDPIPAAEEEAVETGETVAGALVQADPLPEPLPAPPVPEPPVFPEAAVVELPVTEAPPAEGDVEAPPHADGFGPTEVPIPLLLWLPDGAKDSEEVGQSSGIVDDLVSVPSLVVAEVLSVAETQSMGGLGLAFTLTRADGVAQAGMVTVDAVYDAFRHAAGGDLAGRLELVSLPGCARSTPGDPACREQTVVQTDNHQEWGVLRGEVAVAADPSAGGSGQSAGALGEEDPPVYAITSGAEGPSGDYGATPIAPTGEWTVGIGSGDFTWSEPLPSVPLPQGGSGSAPALTYSSGSVDGRTTAENPQASWAGLGWEVSTGSITQVFTACTPPSTESCYYTGDGRYSIVLNGKSSDLVPVAGQANQYRLKDDPGWQVFHDTGFSPSEWVVTTPDGTRFYFGHANVSTRSVWQRPVKNATTGVLESAPWQWSLSHVRDSSDNMNAYYYVPETNYYDSVEGKKLYDRGGYLRLIDFGRIFDGDPETSNLETGRVEFVTKARCTALTTACIEPVPFSEDYPDVPTDLICQAGPTSCAEDSPTFFTTQRLVSVTSSVRSGTTFVPVDQMIFTQAFVDANPALEDVVGPQLWLQEVRTVGLDGDTLDVALPSMKFTHVPLNNRADAIDAWMPRVASVTLPTGGSISVAFGQNRPCDPLPEETGPANDLDCFVAWGELDAGPVGFVWYNKYLVASVTARAGVGGLDPAVDETTTYEYVGTPQIHHDDNEEVDSSQRGWGIWRGYAEVKTVKGAAGLEVDLYKVLRGMHDDKLTETQTLVVNVTDGHGNTFKDYDWFKGRVYEHRRYHGTTLVEFSTTTPGWGRLDPGANDVEDPTTSRMAVDRLQMTTQVVPGGTNRVTKTETLYNGASGGLGITYGLPEHVVEHGDVSTTSDDRCTDTDLYALNTTAWVLVPARVLVRPGISCTSTAAARTDILYDNTTTVGAAPTRGLATTGREYSTSGSYSATLTGYDARGRATSMTDPNGNTSTTTYTPSNPANGLPLETTVTNELGHVTETILHPRRQTPTLVTDPNGHATTIAYDGLGRLVKVWLPTENPTPPRNPPSLEYAYEISQTAPPKVSTFTLQRLTEAGLAERIPTYTFFDGLARERETQVVAPEGDGRIVTATRYDDRGRVAAQTMPMHMADPAGSAIGNPVPAQIPSETRTVYDGLGRATSTTIFSDGVAVPEQQTDTTYLGTSTKVTPARGMPVTTYFDAYARTSKVVEHFTSLDPPYPVTPWDTTYTYDVLDNLKTITDELGNTTTYGYDMQSRRTASDDPDAGDWDYTYDPAGNRIETTDAENQVTWGIYDELNRQIELRKNSATGTLLSSWNYDDGNRRGLLVSSTSRVDGASYTVGDLVYDARDRLTSKTYTIPTAAGDLAGSYAFGYGYDAADHRTSITYPAAGGLPAETVTTQYSPRGYEVSTAGDNVYIAQTHYKNYGLLARRDYGGTGTLTRKYSYDTATRWLDNLRTELGGSVIQDTAFLHDDVGNVTNIKTNVTGQLDECFKYDTANRLIEGTTRTGTSCISPVGGTNGYDQTFRYDPIGRITQRGTVAGLPGAYDRYDYLGTSHAVVAIRHLAGPPPPDDPPPSATYQYDPNGQRTQEQTSFGANPDITTYEWNEKHQLARTDVTVDGGTSTSTYTYDADGNRLIRDDGQVATLYLDNTEIKTGGGTSEPSIRYYTTGTGVMVALREAGQPRTRMILNHQGSTQYLIKNNTTTVNNIEYQPYGKTRTSSGGLATDRRYLHAPNDAATGLIHLGARYYDPGLAQFISPDPLVEPGQPATLNSYTNALNNPTTYTDPTGLAVDPGVGGGNPASYMPNAPAGGSNVGPWYGPVPTSLPFLQAMTDYRATYRSRDGMGYLSEYDKAAVLTGVCDENRSLCPAGMLDWSYSTMTELLTEGTVFTRLPGSGVQLPIAIGGPGEWDQVRSSTRQGAKYQHFAAGSVPGQGYLLGGVEFDGYYNNRLIEAKGEYEFMFQPWARTNAGIEASLEAQVIQARRQNAAAGASGTPVVWAVSGQQHADWLRTAFAGEGFDNITVKHIPQPSWW